MSYDSFSSLPPEEERQFVVFEEFTRTNSKKAMVIGWGSAIGFALFIIVIVFAFKGSLPKQNFGEEPAEEESAPSGVAPAPAPAPAPPPAAPPTAPAGAAPADPAAPAPAGGAAPAPAGGAAPAAPEGATKPPPPM